MDVHEKLGRADICHRYQMPLQDEPRREFTFSHRINNRVWPETDVRHCRESTSEEYHEAHVSAILAAARDSQRKDKRGGPVLENADNQTSVRVEYKATEDEVRAWYHDIVTKTENGRRVLNNSQLRLVEQVVERICQEMSDREAGVVDLDKETLR